MEGVVTPAAELIATLGAAEMHTASFRQCVLKTTVWTSWRERREDEEEGWSEGGGENKEKASQCWGRVTLMLCTKKLSVSDWDLFADCKIFFSSYSSGLLQGKLCYNKTQTAALTLKAMSHSLYVHFVSFPCMKRRSFLIHV